jgi:hypothetical protein
MEEQYAARLNIPGAIGKGMEKPYRMKGFWPGEND